LAIEAVIAVGENLRASAFSRLARGRDRPLSMRGGYTTAAFIRYAAGVSFGDGRDHGAGIAATDARGWTLFDSISTAR
jgi:hypothetical protein